MQQSHWLIEDSTWIFQQEPPFGLQEGTVSEGPRSGPNNGNALTKEKRNKMLELNIDCVHCGTLLSGNNYNTEHILDLSLGGENTQQDLMCKICNSRWRGVKDRNRMRLRPSFQRGWFSLRSSKPNSATRSNTATRNSVRESSRIRRTMNTLLENLLIGTRSDDQVVTRHSQRLGTVKGLFR